VPEGSAVFDWLKRRAADSYKFLRPTRNIDAVVFVHGFNGHLVESWGRFPELLDTDPDLPAMDILLLGYPTGFGLFHPSIERTGDALLSRVGLLLPNAARIVMVCHSMGGVVALSGVRKAMIAEAANSHPVSCLDRFVLFATPLKAQQLATAARHLCFGIPSLLRVFNAQIRQLACPVFGSQFESDVVNRIYRPRKASDTAREIPIHICLGHKDRVVSEPEARGVIRHPTPCCLEHCHTSIKAPDHHGDERYLALKRPLEQSSASWFRVAAAKALDSTDPQQSLAGDEIRERLLFAANARLRSGSALHFETTDESQRFELRDKLLVLACRYALVP
jgi:pimeloyl-ACP methyl ester carboxylesterase